jgi:hypothetical protein
MTIMDVRITLIAREIEKYGMPKLTVIVFQKLSCGCAVWSMSMIPIAVSVMLAESIAVIRLEYIPKQAMYIKQGKATIQ